MPSLSESLLHWPGVPQEAEPAVFTVVRCNRCVCRRTHGRDVEERSEETRHLRVVGAVRAPGAAGSGPDPVLEVPQDQPPHLQHHIEPRAPTLENIRPGHSADGRTVTWDLLTSTVIHVYRITHYKKCTFSTLNIQTFHKAHGKTE